MIQLAARSSACASQGSARAAMTSFVSGAATQSRYGAGPGCLDGAVLVDERVAEAPRDGGLGGVGDLLDDADEQARLLHRRRDEDGAALERLVPPGDRLVGDGVVQRVAGGEQLGAGARVVEHVLDVERDALVAGGDRAAADRAQLRRDVRDLEAALLAAADLAAQPRERRPECALDVVRLQAPGPRLVHQRAQLRDVRVLHRVGRERALGEQLLDAAGDAGVDDLLHVRLGLRELAVADRVDQQRAQRRLAERRAEHVEHLAAVGLALLLDLQQQPREDLALAGVVGDEVPQAADLALADAVDPAEALLDPVRVPRQVVVDHQVRDLEVQALARRRRWRAGPGTSGLCVNSSVIWRRSARRTPPWIALTASGRPSSEPIRRAR